MQCKSTTLFHNNLCDKQVIFPLSITSVGTSVRYRCEAFIHRYAIYFAECNTSFPQRIWVALFWRGCSGNAVHGDGTSHPFGDTGFFQWRFDLPVGLDRRTTSLWSWVWEDVSGSRTWYDRLQDVPLIVLGYLDCRLQKQNNGKSLLAPSLVHYILISWWVYWLSSLSKKIG